MRSRLLLSRPLWELCPRACVCIVHRNWTSVHKRFLRKPTLVGYVYRMLISSGFREKDSLAAWFPGGLALGMPEIGAVYLSSDFSTTDPRFLQVKVPLDAAHDFWGDFAVIT